MYNTKRNIRLITLTTLFVTLVLFLPSAQASESLCNTKNIDNFLEAKKIKFINIDKKEDTLYSYSVNVSLNNPSELYKLIDKINLQNNPISIDYPIVFKNNGTKLDINFILKYHQSSQSQ